jgi:mevalonate kinase
VTKGLLPVIRSLVSIARNARLTLFGEHAVHERPRGIGLALGTSRTTEPESVTSTTVAIAAVDVILRDGSTSAASTE